MKRGRRRREKGEGRRNDRREGEKGGEGRDVGRGGRMEKERLMIVGCSLV
jgi:hypothetical protein